MESNADEVVLSRELHFLEQIYDIIKNTKDVDSKSGDDLFTMGNNYQRGLPTSNQAEDHVHLTGKGKCLPQTLREASSSLYSGKLFDKDDENHERKNEDENKKCMDNMGKP